MGVEALGLIGYAAALCLSAVGSALGTGIGGMSAIGAWKKCYAQNKAAPFVLVVFAGAPFTQTLYGYLLMGTLFSVTQALVKADALAANYMYIFAGGIFGGLAIGASALMQGKAAAAASDAMGETGKGFAQNLLVLGIIESVALFVMIFLMMAIGGLAPAAA
jgi:V/A-type H+-transporting ATPase subunit K